MPKYEVSITFSLTTTIEPDGIRIDEPDGVEDFEDNSYFSDNGVETDGGEVRFTVEAADEYEAEEKAREALDEGNEYEDHNGFTWLVTNVSVDVAQIEEPMTLERAIELLTALFDRLTSGSEVTDEEREAFAYLLKFIATQPRPTADAA